MIKRTIAFSSPAYLSLKGKQLVVKFPDEEKSPCTIPIEDIGVVLLEHRQITITSGLISALVENNCAVVSCNEKNMPTGLILPLEGHTLQSERFTDQINASLPLKKQLWQQTMQYKIRNQAAVLQNICELPATNMLAWAREVKSGDPDNYEGRAAVYYWKNLFPEIDNFKRDRFGDFPNNVLNYGYAILRAVIARALVGSGLLPTLGIHHHNKYNAYCLADDIMEPYRPYVDILVRDLWDNGFDLCELTPEIKRKLWEIPAIDVNMGEKTSPLLVAASTTTSSLAKCYSGEQRKIIYPEIPTL